MACSAVRGGSSDQPTSISRPTLTGISVASRSDDVLDRCAARLAVFLQAE
jgi:hypothetical protein